VKNAYADHYLSDYALDDLLRKRNFLLFEIKVKIAHRQILHNDVDMCLILEGFANAGQKIWMADLLYELALQHVELSDLSFLNYFHSVLLPSFLLLGLHNASEGALSQILLALVVLGASLGTLRFLGIVDLII
jgi:hypothetical protein